MPKVSKSSILERIPDIFFRLDENGRVVYLNEAWEFWSGVPREKVEGGAFVEHLPPSDRGDMEKALKDLRAANATRKELAFRLSSEDPEEVSFRLLLQKNKDSGAIEGVARMEQGGEGEAEAREGADLGVPHKGWSAVNARLALFPEIAPIPLLECDRAGKVSYLNPVAHRFLNEYGSKGELDFLPAQHEQLVQNVLRTGKDVERELDLNGRVLTWLYSKPEGYDRVHIRGHDITEQKRVEAELLDAIVQTQEEDRDRLAKELHEGVGQQLSAILMHFEDLRGELPPEHVKKAEEIRDHLKECIQEVRTVSHGLMPNLLKEFGLVSAMEDLSKHFWVRSGIELHSEISIREDHIEDRIKVAVYRLVQELVQFATHVRKTREFSVRLYEEDEGIIFWFRDEGALQDPATGGSLRDFRKFDSMVRSMHGRLNLILEGEDSPCLEVRIPFHEP